MNVRYITNWASSQYSLTLPIFSWALLGTLAIGIIIYAIWRYWW